MCVLGIDPSLSATAIVILNERGELAEQKTYRTMPQPGGVGGRIDRLSWLAADIQRDIADMDIAVACIEGYSMGSNQAQHSAIVECGYELRRLVWQTTGDACRLVEVAPSTLKKFCTGKGNGDKTAIGSHLTARYGVTFNSNDEADAYGLARMALCIAGYAEPANQAQREAVDVAMNGKAKRPGKSKRAMVSGGPNE
jgi:crossover junction endodeoxyribonuclease RuvC